MAREYRPTPHVPGPPWAEPIGPSARITRVRTILTAPEGVTLVVVKVDTDVDGLYGLGCATFTQRAYAVRTAVDEYAGPLVAGRDVADITDIAEGLRLDSYWRDGPVLNSALSGIDMALWDIAGKLAGMPVWRLLGGRVREVVPAYTHAYGGNAAELGEQVRRAVADGYRFVRCQVEVPGSVTYGAAPSGSTTTTWDAEAYLRLVPAVLAEVRDLVGDEVELLHDAHERLTPQQAIRLARDVEPARLYFLEDPVAPEDAAWLGDLRRHSTTPIAFGELLTQPGQYVPLVAERAIDFVRCHLSAIGGLTPGRRLAALCEAFGVRTAWHGPRDVSPVGHAANVALDVASPAFGVQEHHEFGPRAREVFPGTLTARDGVIRPPETPGLGVDVDEEAAARFPPVPALSNWHYARVRRPDGSVQRP